MSTFGQLIDRTYREYLRPVEEQEPLTQVANTVIVLQVAQVLHLLLPLLHIKQVY